MQAECQKLVLPVSALLRGLFAIILWVGEVLRGAEARPFMTNVAGNSSYFDKWRALGDTAFYQAAKKLPSRLAQSGVRECPL